MDLVREASKQFGKQPALLTQEGALSFTRCERESARMASTLASLGIGCGDIVGIVAPNGAGQLLLLMALLRIGAVAAPINHRLPANRIDGIIERLAPKLTIYDPLACLSLTVDRSITFETFDALKRAHGSTKFEVAQGTDRPVSIIHTSASSGNPKAALHSLSNHWHNAMGSTMNLPFRPGDCWLLSLPLYHVGGYSMLFKCLLDGGAIAIPSAGEPTADSLSRYPVTHLSLVPTQLYRMLCVPGGAGRLRNLRAILLGGSAAGSALLEEAVEAALPLYLTYGSTEMGSQVSTSRCPVTAPSTDSGILLPYREATISKEGEILLKGPCLFMGYLHNEGLDKARDRHGWFHTGDIGTLSDTGVLTMLGRRDNMFISGGENVHPEEIEQALVALPGIEEALVVSLEDREYGARPVAWIRVSKDEAPEDEEITRSVAEAVGRLKTPVKINRVTEWVTIAGSPKIDRRWYRKKTEEKEIRD